MKKITIALSLLMFPALAFAANQCSNPSANNALGNCVSQIYIWALGAAGILALLYIVVGGYITLTAAGNAERASRGKSYIWSSLIGLALLAGAYIILNTINPDLTNFNFNPNDPKYQIQNQACNTGPQGCPPTNTGGTGGTPISNP